MFFTVTLRIYFRWLLYYWFYYYLLELLSIVKTLIILYHSLIKIKIIIIAICWLMFERPAYVCLFFLWNYLGNNRNRHGQFFQGLYKLIATSYEYFSIFQSMPFRCVLVSWPLRLSPLRSSASQWAASRSCAVDSADAPPARLLAQSPAAP